MFKVKDETKKQIMYDLIEPSYTNDIEDMIREKKCWRILGISFETISKILVATGGVLSFSAGYFKDYPNLSFISGSISTISLACLQFSSFSYIQNTKQSKELNILLKSLNLDPLPVLVLNNDEETKDTSYTSLPRNVPSLKSLPHLNSHLNSHLKPSFNSKVKEPPVLPSIDKLSTFYTSSSTFLNPLPPSLPSIATSLSSTLSSSVSSTLLPATDLAKYNSLMNFKLSYLNYLI